MGGRGGGVKGRREPEGGLCMGGVGEGGILRDHCGEEKSACWHSDPLRGGHHGPCIGIGAGKRKKHRDFCDGGGGGAAVHCTPVQSHMSGGRSSPLQSFKQLGRKEARPKPEAERLQLGEGCKCSDEIISPDVSPPAMMCRLRSANLFSKENEFSLSFARVHIHLWHEGKDLSRKSCQKTKNYLRAFTLCDRLSALP
jgi:hypothetical protein